LPTAGGALYARTERNPNGASTMTHPDASRTDQRRADPRAGGERRARTGDTSIEAVVERLRGAAELKGSFTAWHETPPRPPRTAPFPAGLAPELVALLRRRGLGELYEHQARAIELALAGRDVLIATPTASGKTLAYSAPVLQALLESDGAARALWLFPTKALSQDQSRGLNALIEELGRGWHSFTYDGDTPPSVRRTLRERGHVVLTNPYMLHQGILPNHAKWSELFAALRYVVIDEVHTLNGVFGSSVANVLRRLVRIARHYGAEPRFLLSSATVRDPAEHARALLGREVAVVGEDASPSGRRHFAVYDPPIVDAVAGLRANALEEVRRLAPYVCGPAHQTIFFCNRRTSVEVLTRYLKEAAPRLGLAESEIRGYRGGYLPDLRRAIEAGLKDGTVKVVVSTNALELGIDIGRLDVAVLVGYPGSQASFWQRVGRVGRRGGTSLAVLVARADPVDQYLAQHPAYLFGEARERLGLDPDNLVLLSEQLKCAAFELPFHGQGDGSVTDFGPSPHVAGVLDYLAEESKLLLARPDAARGGRTWYWAADAYPAQDVSLAGSEPDNVLVFDEEENAIGEVDRVASLTSVHEGAIYLVEGETYKVERFDYANRRAYVRKLASDYFTEAETDTEVRVLRLEEKAERLSPAGLSEVQAWRGEVHVTTVATMYKKIRFYTRENVGAGDIHLPAEEVDTEAFVLTLAPELAAELELTAGNRGAAWAGVGRLLGRTAPLFVRCGASDLGLSTEVRSGHFERPAIFLYDRIPGGVALAVSLFRAQREIVRAARLVLAGCACEFGCPACIGPLEEVGPLGKPTALAVLTRLDEGSDFVPAALPPSEEPAG
jgi:DEAD/DEAH box helicase domain-containing protein